MWVDDSDRKCREPRYTDGQLDVAETESFTHRFVRVSFDSVKILKHMRRLHGGNNYEVLPFTEAVFLDGLQHAHENQASCM